jgi:P-type Ca2+ transporter type 2C
MLQSSIETLSYRFLCTGAWSTILLFMILLIRFLAQLSSSTSTPKENALLFLQILTISLIPALISRPEGLQLGFTSALSVALNRMGRCNNLVTDFAACETLGNVTTICTDKQGTLTENEMTVIAISVADCRVVVTPEIMLDSHRSDELTEVLAEDIQSLLLHNIINTTAFEGTGNIAFTGCKMDVALLNFAKRQLGWSHDYRQQWDEHIVDLTPFHSERKYTSCIVRIPSQSIHRVYVKGACEIVASRCTAILENGAAGRCTVRAISHDEYQRIESNTNQYTSRGFRTLTFAYRDLHPDNSESSWTKLPQESLVEQLTLVGVVAIQDALRPGLTKFVTDCHESGIVVRMITGDHIQTAKQVARECGLYTSGGIAIEGPRFRTLSPPQRQQIAERIQILARCNPRDKEIFVTCLRTLGETVAVTGDGSNDGPALKLADVAIAMGNSGSDIAREASSVILKDNDLRTITVGIEFGRCVTDTMKKIVQVMGFFQQF